MQFRNFRGSKLFVGALLAAATFVPAQAATIYATGFETPTFTVGGVNGQDSWVGVNSSIINGAGAFAGSQYIGISAGGSAFRHADPGASTNIDTQAELEFTGGGMSEFNVWGAGGLYIAFVQIDPSTGNVTFGTGESYSVGALANNTYYLADINLNTVTNTYTFSLGGLSYGSSLASQHAVNFYGTNFVSFGNLSVDNLNITGNAASGTPEPSTLVMLGGGLAMLAVGAARRKK